MEENDFLKSKNGRKCLTKCNNKGNNFIHPVLLNNQINYLEDVCAIYPIYIKNNGDIVSKETEACNIEDNYITKIPDENEMLLLQFHFNPVDFLNTIYDIYNFEDMIEFVENNKRMPEKTLIRIHNCGLKAFGKNGIKSVKVYEFYYKHFDVKISFDKFVKNINDFIKNNKDTWDSYNCIYDLLKKDIKNITKL